MGCQYQPPRTINAVAFLAAHQCSSRGAGAVVALRRAVAGRVEVVVPPGGRLADRVHIFGLLGRRSDNSTCDGRSEHERSPSSGGYLETKKLRKTTNHKPLYTLTILCQVLYYSYSIYT